SHPNHPPLWIAIGLVLEGDSNYRESPAIRYRSSQLRRLEIEWSEHVIYQLPKALKKFPLLEELSLRCIQIPEGAIQTLGRDCPMLKTLKLKRCMLTDTGLLGLAIAENVPGLRHLQLKWCKLTDTGLRAILDRCRHLQVLDLNKCYPINLTGELRKRCSQQIKCVKFTDRSLSIMEDDLDVILLEIIKSAYV
nr:hypothetical protein [Tanacetum cinerariifolium]